MKAICGYERNGIYMKLHGKEIAWGWHGPFANAQDSQSTMQKQHCRAWWWETEVVGESEWTHPLYPPYIDHRPPDSRLAISTSSFHLWSLSLNSRLQDTRCTQLRSTSNLKQVTLLHPLRTRETRKKNKKKEKERDVVLTSKSIKQWA